MMSIMFSYLPLSSSKVMEYMKKFDLHKEVEMIDWSNVFKQCWLDF